MKLKRFIPYILPYKKQALLNIFFNVLYSLFSALSFIALIPMLDVLFGKNKPISEPPVYSGSLMDLGGYGKAYLNYQVGKMAGEDTIWALAIVIALVISLFLLKNMFSYLASLFITYLRNGVLRDLRDSLYKKIISQPVAFFSDQRKGDIISRMVGDVNEVQYSLLSGLEAYVREPLTILFSIIVMLGISVKLTVFTFVFIPIAAAVISKIGKSLKKNSIAVQQEQGRFLSLIEETIGGLRVIKAFTAERIFTQRFGQSSEHFMKMSNKVMNRQNLGSPMSEFLGILMIAILLWFGGSLVLLDKTLEGTQFIAFMGLAYNILTPAKAISKASYDMKRGNAAADVLTNFTLEVPKGKTVALVGQSGSGKSTVANLITRFYDVNEGQVLIDGVDVRDMQTDSLRHLIGVVSQDSILFNDTIKNNLLIGKPSATDEEIIAATKIANAYEFIQDLPDGLDTNIGDAGSKLSGGQKQRLSIARAVLKNPPIMVLDEATSALDTESERLVQVALENMMKNRTSVVIAHRLSTIQNADHIVVMQKGQIVEQGTHMELLQKQGMYKKLVEMQSFE